MSTTRVSRHEIYVMVISGLIGISGAILGSVITGNYSLKAQNDQFKFSKEQSDIELHRKNYQDAQAAFIEFNDIATEIQLKAIKCDTDLILSAFPKITNASSKIEFLLGEELNTPTSNVVTALVNVINSRMDRSYVDSIHNNALLRSQLLWKMVCNWKLKNMKRLSLGQPEDTVKPHFAVGSGNAMITYP